MPDGGGFFSRAEQYGAQPDIRAQWEKLTPAEANELFYDWSFWARQEQLEPAGDWSKWLLLAGRGFGKTRTGAEWVRLLVESGRAKRIGLIGPTNDDARKVIVEGESGILETSPPWNRPTYVGRQLTWPNGAIAVTYSAEEPDRLRGPQHDAIWADELAAWKYPATWDMAMFGLRLGRNPRALITTTPRPTPEIREMIDDPDTIVTGGSTYANRANLPAVFFRQIVSKYEGTRLGRQELNAEILDDLEGALWTRQMIEECFIKKHHVPTLVRIVVAIDPAVTSGDDADDTGIVVVALGDNGHYYVFEDATCHLPPNEWAQKAIGLYHLHQADRIIAEVNNGGDLVSTVIWNVDSEVAFGDVRASRGKITRAEPVSALYEQNRVHHVGHFPKLEDEMCSFLPGMKKSPDRVDALVWGITDLMQTGEAVVSVF